MIIENAELEGAGGLRIPAQAEDPATGGVSARTLGLALPAVGRRVVTSARCPVVVSRTSVPVEPRVSSGSTSTSGPRRVIAHSTAMLTSRAAASTVEMILVLMPPARSGPAAAAGRSPAGSAAAAIAAARQATPTPTYCQSTPKITEEAK